MTVAVWVEATAALIAAVTNLVSSLRHRKLDNQRFAEVHDKIDGTER